MGNKVYNVGSQKHLAPSLEQAELRQIEASAFFSDYPEEDTFVHSPGWYYYPAVSRFDDLDLAWCQGPAEGLFLGQWNTEYEQFVVYQDQLFEDRGWSPPEVHWFYPLNLVLPRMPIVLGQLRKQVDMATKNLQKLNEDRNKAEDFLRELRRGLPDG